MRTQMAWLHKHLHAKAAAVHFAVFGVDNLLPFRDVLSQIAERVGAADGVGLRSGKLIGQPLLVGLCFLCCHHTIATGLLKLQPLPFVLGGGHLLEKLRWLVVVLRGRLLLGLLLKSCLMYSSSSGKTR